jgi:hypothetical protein
MKAVTNMSAAWQTQKTSFSKSLMACPRSLNKSFQTEYLGKKLMKKTEMNQLKINNLT